MGERSDEIEERINRTRGELSENFSELEEKVRNAFDWRAQFEERPMAFLAVAFGGGVLASAVLPGARRGRRQVVECANVSTRNEARASAKERIPPAVEGKRKRNYVGLDAFKGALITVAASKIGGALGEFLSTYRNELHRARAARRD
jgi:hypothetical protein